jgi:hypothetical protein
MAGCPKRRELRRIVADAGGTEPLLERVANGETVSKIAESMGVSRGMLSAFLNSDEHAVALQEARRRAATILVEEALDIADHARPLEVQVAKLRTDVRLWAARAWDRNQFGEKQQVPLALSFAHLHAQVVRECCKREAQKRRELEARTLTIEAPPQDGKQGEKQQ